MSVPVHKRSENKLQALKDTLAMTSYTVQMCENEKIFPKKCRWTLCTRIIDTCLDSIIKIRQANKVRPANIEQARLRVRLQYQVLMNFEALWGLMTVAFESYSIPSEKVGIWSQKMLTAEECVAAWRKNDMSRFKEQFAT